MSRNWWRVYVAAGAVATVVYAVLPEGLASDALYALIALSSVGAVHVGLRTHRPANRAPWILMMAAQLLWAVGGAVLGITEHITRTASFPSVSDALYLAGYPFLFAVLVLVLRSRRTHRDLIGAVDTAIVTIGLGLLVWTLIGHPVLDASRHTTQAGLVSMAYLLADLLLLAGVVHLVLTSGARNKAFRLLIVAVALLLVGDVATSWLGVWAGGNYGTWCNVAYLASYVAGGGAALHHSMAALTQRGRRTDMRFTRKRLAALGLASLVTPGVLAGQRLAGSPIDVWWVVIGSVLVYGLVVTRMQMVIRHIQSEQKHREKLQADLTFQANHDALTGLPNRAQALETITAALGRAQRGGYYVGLLFVDLDEFKAVNDTHGHAAGDKVLQVVAQRLHQQVRNGDIVARLGGDEFVVLLEQLDAEADALNVAHRMVDAAAAPIPLTGGVSARVGASVGMAIAQDGSIDADRLLQEADTAAYRAKAAGRGRVEVFGETLRGELAERAKLEGALIHAIANDELVIHYQPIVDLETSRTRGYEALVRWQRPGYGLLQPADFVPTAEASSLICDLDGWVLRRACKQLAEWTRNGGDDLTVAVNISGRHLSAPRIVADVRQALLGSNLHGRQLVLEITETVLVDNLLALHHLQQLRELGVAVSIDDFGTGYNSITRLRDLPVDIIKIDRSYVTDTDAEPARKLLELMVHAAHAFDIPVVVEGVEHEYQVEMLRDFDCESAQGFHLCRPLPAEQIARGIQALR